MYHFWNIALIFYNTKFFEKKKKIEKFEKKWAEKLKKK